jgi:acyl-CoA reductase-like NAD-dependent aldehyde dehydrogenase
MYIDGKWTPAGSGRTLPVINPATSQQLAEVALAGQTMWIAPVRAARAFDDGPWPQLDPLERGQYLQDG